MERAINYLLRRHEPQELQLTFIRWGLLDTSICSRLKRLSNDKNLFHKELLGCCIALGFTWRDVASLDLLLAMSFPEKLVWQPFDIPINGPRLSVELLQDALAKVGQYYDVISRATGDMLWYRVSKPEQHRSCYLILMSPENRFILGSDKSCEVVVHVAEALIGLLSEDFSCSDGRNPETIEGR